MDHLFFTPMTSAARLGHGSFRFNSDKRIIPVYQAVTYFSHVSNLVVLVIDSWPGLGNPAWTRIHVGALQTLELTNHTIIHCTLCQKYVNEISEQKSTSITLCEYTCKCLKKIGEL